jgi:hypothetical protein
MNVLYTYIFNAMLSWIPLNQHCYYPVSQECLNKEEQFYHEVANDIVDVMNEPTTVLPFTDAEAKVKTALLMTAIAATESGFNRDVDSCKVTGDHGLALGMWQTHTSRADSCLDRKKAIRKALDIVNISFNMCKLYPVLDKMSGYTTGSCHINSTPSRYKVGKALNYLTAHPYKEEEELDLTWLTL